MVTSAGLSPAWPLRFDAATTANGRGSYAAVQYLHLCRGRLHLPQCSMRCTGRDIVQRIRTKTMFSLFVLAVQAATGRIAADALGRSTL
jgi:hypothetical protein